jgi:hypothetical protein
MTEVVLTIGCKICDFSASSTTKTGRHEIAEKLLKVALNKKKQR